MLRYRIVTFISEKHRYFAVRKVFYDNSMTPMYSEDIDDGVWYMGLGKLKEDHPQRYIWNFPILDADNYLKVWNCDNDDLSLDKK